MRLITLRRSPCTPPGRVLWLLGGLFTALCIAPVAARAQDQAPDQAQLPVPASAPMAPGPEAQVPVTLPLTTLQLLRDKGLITQKEYEDAMLGRTPGPGAVPPPPPAAAPQQEIVSSKWGVSLYGFAEVDTIYDTTQGFNDLAGNATIPRPGSLASATGRFQLSVRNSRIGLKIKAPEFHRFLASAVAEMDFLGNQPTDASEAAFFNNPTFRIRHMYLKLEDPWVDVLIGQTWELFGWQSYFHPNTVEIQGVAGQIYSRTAQVRLSHTFKSAPVDFDIAAAVLRPLQRNSSTPDGQAGLRLLFNKWKGVHTIGSTATQVDAGGIGVSGALRQFEVPGLMNQGSTTGLLGWGVSVDALLPLVPARQRQAWALTANLSYVRGSGINDLYTGLTGGVSLPATVGTAMTAYKPGLDNGFVGFGKDGNPQTVDWQSFWAGLQLYLPPGGRWWISGNFSQMDSDNSQLLGDPKKVFTRERRADANLFWDATPAVRLGVAYVWVQQTYGDGMMVANQRAQLSAFYLF